MNPTPDHVRRIRITFRVSALEHETLRGATARAGLSLSSYVRQALLEVKPPRSARRPTVEATSLADLLTCLGKLAEPLQQIATVANALSGNASMLPSIERELLRCLRELRELRSVALRALGRSEPTP
jgi:uncharacterized protein (DUF1778 family)